jgi:copper oxidase (laccase) domain-containing protein
MSLNKQVSDERLSLFSKLNVDPNNVYSCEQTHSRDVCIAENSVLIKQADGLIGIAPSILSVTVADCLPVFLYDSKNNVFAICHSGWKGTGIAVSALHLMQNNFNTNA